MNKKRSRVDVGLVMLAVLAVFSVVLSVAALKSHPALVASSADPLPNLVVDQASASQSPSASAPHPSNTPQTPVAATSTSPTAAPPLTVVVLGDGNSAGDPSSTWVGIAEKQLGWSKVINLSAPGRGYVKSPRVCDTTPCANFDGSLSAVVKAHPDIVVTFGGTADGDYDLSPAVGKYFSDLHRQLPDAQLVAVSPVTTLSPVPYYFTLHDQRISAAIDKVGGTFINVGQPGSGDGSSLSSAAQTAIAAKIVSALS